MTTTKRLNLDEISYLVYSIKSIFPYNKCKRVCDATKLVPFLWRLFLHKPAQAVTKLFVIERDMILFATKESVKRISSLDVGTLMVQ